MPGKLAFRLKAIPHPDEQGVYVGAPSVLHGVWLTKKRVEAKAALGQKFSQYEIHLTVKSREDLQALQDLHDYLIMFYPEITKNRKC